MFTVATIYNAYNILWFVGVLEQICLLKLLFLLGSLILHTRLLLHALLNCSTSRLFLLSSASSLLTLSANASQTLQCGLGLGL